MASCEKPTTVIPRPKVAAGTGRITGVVHVSGTKREARVVGGECCPGSPPVYDESFAGNGSALANVVVWIENGPNIDVPMPDAALLTQRDCKYEPYVLAVRAGQKINVTSHDAKVHNVNYVSRNNGADNFSENNGDSRGLTFNQPDTVKFSCSVHPWMRATVRVFDHPCFAVTDMDGKFEIDHLPPGTYTVVAEHEMEQQRSTVTVGKDAVAVDFVYR